MKRILGLLGWLGVVLVLAAVAIRFAKPELVEWYQGLAIAGLVTTLLYTLSQWRDISRSMGSRGTKYGSIALGSVLLFLGLLIGINYIGSRQTKRWDLTGSGQFTLSDQTKKILGELKKPLVIRIFFASGAANDVRDRIEGYEQTSKNVTVELIDAEKNPTKAQAMGVTQYGTVIMEYDGRTERTTTLEEQDLTNTIIKIVEGKTKKLYFVTGHGERDPLSQDPRAGYSAAATKLKNDNYDVAKLALAQEGKVPDDATLIVIAGPEIDYLAGEIEAIKSYLARGGKLMMMLDPSAKPDAKPLDNLIGLAKEWGVAIGNDLVVDASGMGRQIGAGPEIPLALQYPPHPITDKFANMTAYRLVRSATPVEGGTNGHVAQRVIESSPKSWAESDLKSLATGGGAVGMDPAKGDKPGPVAMASAVSAPATAAPPPAPGTDAAASKMETRVVVTGDSDFAGNDMIPFAGNGDVFMNMANWAAQQDNLIAIRPRDPLDRRISLSEGERQGIFYLAVFGIPGLLMAAGVATWWKRR
jgi:ABC-type uncharacterized transport system involved in gliding motility auxiliary subunit